MGKSREADSSGLIIRMDFFLKYEFHLSNVT